MERSPQFFRAVLEHAVVCMLSGSPAHSPPHPTCSRFQLSIVAYSPAAGILRLPSGLPGLAGLGDAQFPRKDLRAPVKATRVQVPRARSELCGGGRLPGSPESWGGAARAAGPPAGLARGRLSGGARTQAGRCRGRRRGSGGGPWRGLRKGPLILLSWSMEPKLKEEIILLMLSSPNPHLSLPWSPALASKGLERAPDF